MDRGCLEYCAERRSCSVLQKRCICSMTMEHAFSTSMNCAVIGTVNNRRRARIIVNLSLKEFYKNVTVEQFLGSCDPRPHLLL